MAKKNKRYLKNNKGLAIGLALVLILLAKALVFESHVMKKQTMQGSLFKGDYVIINKLGHGARTPITPLAIPFTKWYSNLIELPSFRLPGFNPIKHGDVIAFNYPLQYDSPIDKKAIEVKRCVALPGDALIIAKKNVYINNKLQPFPDSVHFKYRISSSKDNFENEARERFNITTINKIHPKGIYDFSVTAQKAKWIKCHAGFSSLRHVLTSPEDWEHDIFPYSKFHPWTKDYYGKFTLPKKGQKVLISGKNYELYKHLINHYEGKEVYLTEAGVVLEGKPAKYYTFTQNYYFVLDDNRDFAKDSRYWGPVPESHIIGKVNRVTIPYNSELKKLEWKRLFKKI
jgi:signal peptidase I